MSPNRTPAPLRLVYPFRSAVAALLSLGLLAALFSGVDRGRLFENLAGAAPRPLLFALAVNLAFPPLAAWRWKASLRLLGLEVSYGRALSLSLAAWPLSSVTPAKSGDLVRAWAFRPEGEGTRALLSLVVERAVDLILLAVLAFSGCLALFPEEWKWTLGGLFGVVCGALLAWRIVHRRGWGWIPERWRPPRGTAPPGAGTLAAALAGSLGVWVLSVVQWQTTLAAFGVRETFPAALARVPPALLAGMVPFTWAGIGTRDGAFLALYAGTAAAERVLAASLAFTTVRYLVPGLMGLPWTYRLLAGEKNRFSRGPSEEDPAA